MHQTCVMLRSSAGVRGGWLLALVFTPACNDDTTEVVTKDVCYSEMRWVGGKRGSEEMFPGRDCVGCHIDNDGPQLALGGTVYSYVLGTPEEYATLQTGTDCFGLEGVKVTVTDASGQLYELTTNRAGNFFVEGDPRDFDKQGAGFTVQLEYEGIKPPMGVEPRYGGCAHCHDPTQPPATETGVMYDRFPTDAEFRYPTGRIGIQGYSPNGPDTPTVEEELRAMGEARAMETEQ